VHVLFVDDDPDNVAFCIRALSEAGVATAKSVTTVEEAVVALHDRTVDILVMDLFMPMGASPAAVLGPRARKYAENLSDLGGLVLLDELERVPSPPVTLLHTACRDHVVLELARERVASRIRKPAPAEVLLEAVLQAIRERAPG
jgi:CheY-like chemotaxis protein